MLFLFNGALEAPNKPIVKLHAEAVTDIETGQDRGTKVSLQVKSANNVVENIQLFECFDEELSKIVRSNCNSDLKRDKKLSRIFLVTKGRKVLFNYRTKQLASYDSSMKIDRIEKQNGRSMIVVINPGRVSVSVDRRNFGPINHKYLKDANLTVSVLMPKWSRWWKIKHPIYIETKKFDTRTNLLSLSFIDREGIKSNIIKYEDIRKDIPVIDVDAPKGAPPAKSRETSKPNTYKKFDKKPYSKKPTQKPYKK